MIVPIFQQNFSIMVLRVSVFSGGRSEEIKPTGGKRVCVGVECLLHGGIPSGSMKV